MKKRSYILILSVLGLVFFISLVILKQQLSMPKIDEGGLLSGTPCSPPCYSGIIPGITPIDQVEDLLKKNNRWVNCQEDNSNPDSKGLYCDYVFIGYDRTKGNMVDGIGFTNDPNVTVEEIVNKYGFPDSVKLSLSGVSIQEIGMALFYDQFKMRLSLEEKKMGIYNLESNTKIIDVAYFDDEEYESQTKSYTSPWKGYGNYEFHIP
jgi:hypothetical protein